MRLHTYKLNNISTMNVADSVKRVLRTHYNQRHSGMIVTFMPKTTWYGFKYRCSACHTHLEVK